MKTKTTTQSLKYDREKEARIEAATLEAMTVRDTVFDLEDEELILLADALLYAIGQTARRHREKTAVPSEQLAVAA